MKIRITSLIISLLVSCVIFCSCDFGNGCKVNFNDGSKIIKTLKINSIDNFYFPSAPTKTGYSFAGWFYDNSSYETKCTKNNLQDRLDSKNISLYAKWTLQTYTITYNLFGGLNPSSNPESYNIESNTINLLSPTKEGYIFYGWYTNSNFSGFAITNIAKGSTGDYKLYAKWVDKSVTYTKIYSVIDLKNITKNLNGSYELMNDIDLNNQEWLPIGENQSLAFTGIFDGGNHTISNLKITTGREFNGLFAFAENATFSDLIIKNVNISTNYTTTTPRVGGLVGYAKDSTFTNCGTTGTIKSNSIDCTNTFVGYAEDSKIEDCTSNSGNIQVYNSMSIIITNEDIFKYSFTYDSNSNNGLKFTESTIMKTDSTEQISGLAPGTNGKTQIIWGSNSDIEYEAEIDISNWIYDIQNWVIYDSSLAQQTDYNNGENITYEPILWTITKLHTTPTQNRTQNIINNGKISQIKNLCPTTNLLNFGTIQPHTSELVVEISWQWIFEASYICTTRDTTIDQTPELAPAPNKVNYPKGAMLSTEEYNKKVESGEILAGNWEEITNLFHAYQYLNESSGTKQFTHIESENETIYYYGDVINEATYNELTSTEKSKFKIVSIDLADTILADRSTYVYSAIENDGNYQAEQIITENEYEEGIKNHTLTEGNWLKLISSTSPTITYKITAIVTEIIE